MKYFMNKNTGDIFAYNSEQLNQVSRISELEVLLQEKEPDFIEVSNNLKFAENELHDARVQLQQRITDMSIDESIDIDNNDDIKLLVHNVDDKTAKYHEVMISFEKIESEYQQLKNEYDSIVPVFFEIREHLKVIKKMTDKEVDAYTNPPISKGQQIAEAEQKKKALLAEANNAIAPLQDAADLDIATDEEIALLKEWKKYRVLLNRVDTSTAPEIDWTEKPSS